MRSRVSALVFSFLLLLALVACNKSSQNTATTDNTSAQPNQMAGSTSQPSADQSQTAASNPAPATPAPSDNAMKQQAKKEAPAPPPPPLVVPAGTNLLVRMGSTIDTKTATSGQSFTGTLARAVSVDGEIALPSGTGVSGTVVDSKSPGRFKGEGVLSVSLNSIDVGSVPTTIETAAYTVSVKGKGKRTAVLTGGGAGAGALIGGLAGGGKGALIGGLVGAGAGGAGSAFTGNKDLRIPAESVVTFKLANDLTVKRTGKKAKKASASDDGTANQ